MTKPHHKTKLQDQKNKNYLRKLWLSIRAAILNNCDVSWLPHRPFPSSSLPPLQSESKCEVFVMVISSTLHMNEK